MNTYVSFLRGINISGQKLIKMADLKNMLNSLHLEHVTTYIQSGNIVFQHALKNLNVLNQKIEKGILDHFGYEVKSITLPWQQLNEILNSCPYDGNDLKEKQMIYFTFLHSQPDESLIEKLNTFSDNCCRYSIQEQVIYLFCDKGYGKTVFNNNFFESKLKVMATTRNLNTVVKMKELAEETASNTKSL